MSRYLFPEILEKAFHLAESGQPGPVLINVPMDMFSKSIPNNLFEKITLNTKKIINHFHKDYSNERKIVFFGIASAIALTVHSIFLGIKFDNDLYKLFRRVIMLSFIIFEIVAQAYLVSTLYSFKDKLMGHISYKILKLKLILVSILIIVALISIPIISLPGNNFFGFNLKFFKHALEWDYFLGVIFFYFLTFLMWKKIKH